MGRTVAPRLGLFFRSRPESASQGFLMPSSGSSHTALASCASWLKHELKQLHSDKPLDLCTVTAGKPLLLVNTASDCGFTGQFEGLEELHQQYKDQGLVIIGFPSNAFDQAAKNEEEAAKVCFYNFTSIITSLSFLSYILTET